MKKFELIWKDIANAICANYRTLLIVYVTFTLLVSVFFFLCGTVQSQINRFGELKEAKKSYQFLLSTPASHYTELEAFCGFFFEENSPVVKSLKFDNEFCDYVIETETRNYGWKGVFSETQLSKLKLEQVEIELSHGRWFLEEEIQAGNRCIVVSSQFYPDILPNCYLEIAGEEFLVIGVIESSEIKGWIPFNSMMFCHNDKYEFRFDSSCEVTYEKELNAAQIAYLRQYTEANLFNNYYYLSDGFFFSFTANITLCLLAMALIVFNSFGLYKNVILQRYEVCKAIHLSGGTPAFVFLNILMVPFLTAVLSGISAILLYKFLLFPWLSQIFVDLEQVSVFFMILLSACFVLMVFVSVFYFKRKLNRKGYENE